jgi:ATP-binding cassette subfamily C protein
LLLRDFFVYAGAKGIKALVFVFLGALVEGVGLVLLIPFFSVIIDGQTSGGWFQRVGAWLFALFSVESRLAKLGLLVVFSAVLMVTRAVIIAVRDVTMAELEIGYIQQIRSRITRRLAAAPWDTVSRLRHSRITHLMGTDIYQLQSATYTLLHDAVAVVMLVSQIVLAFLLAPVLAALALGVVLLGALAFLPMISRARRIGGFVTSANLSLIDDIAQFLGALKLAISQNLQDSFTREFDATLSELRAEQVGYVRQQTVTRLAITTAFAFVGGIAVWLGIATFDIPTSVLITLLLVLSRMSGPATQLQLDAQHISQALPAFEKIRGLENDLAAAEVPAYLPGGVDVAPTDGLIAFHNVSFLHEATGSPGGVRDIDVVIEAGSIVGVTGQSGAGKTTFADLMVGLYPPQSGEILVGGVALRGPAVIAWRNMVSYVSQDPFMFHDTIRRNLEWANPGADEAALWDALRMAGAEGIVRNVGIDAVVGERGSLLSGGERQRLCLARGLLRRPRLLVLDEATSAVDIDGESALLDRLLHLAPRPTIIIIAHRQETLRHCERVLVFEGGRLVSDSATPKAIIGLSQAV